MHCNVQINCYRLFLSDQCKICQLTQKMMAVCSVWAIWYQIRVSHSSESTHLFKTIPCEVFKSKLHCIVSSNRKPSHQVKSASFFLKNSAVAFFPWRILMTFCLLTKISYSVRFLPQTNCFHNFLRIQVEKATNFVY